MSKTMMTRVLILAPVAIGLFTACTKKGGVEMHAQPNVELIQDMMDQAALKPQDYEPHARDQAASRMPPEGTVPVDHKVYPFHQNPQGAQAKLKNPMAGNLTAEVLKVGRVKFETYCAVCHGYEGKGDGPVSPKMALKPPSLVSEKIVNLNDAGIFHIITDGQGVMASYAFQLVDENDRWAIVNYVRSLQALARGGAAKK